MAKAHEQGLQRALGPLDATSLVVGTIIGTGIFLKTATMALDVGSTLLVLVAWAVAGMLSLCGALAYAELGELFPRAGGEAVYLQAAYGDCVGFLYGWQRFWISSPGSIAAYGAGAATFLSVVIPLGAGGRQLVALFLILNFTAINCLAVQIGGRTQTFLTILKTLLILGLAGALLFLAPAAIHSSGASAGAPASSWTGFGLAVLAALWAFDGWNNLPMAAGEVREPARTVPLALIVGVALVFVLYALANIGYFRALSLEEILGASSRLHPDAPPVAALAAGKLIGASGGAFLALAMTISALGAMNGSILTGSRVPYALAERGLFPRFLAQLSVGANVPAASVLVQGAWACVLVSSGTFDQLTDWVIFSSWIFYGLCGFAVLIFRRRLPGARRHYRVPLYPALPLVFCALALLLLVNTIVSMPKESALGLAFILLGLPFYLLQRKKA